MSTVLKSNDDGSLITTNDGFVLIENYPFDKCFKSDGQARLVSAGMMGIDVFQNFSVMTYVNTRNLGKSYQQWFNVIGQNKNWYASPAGGNWGRLTDQQTVGPGFGTSQSFTSPTLQFLASVYTDGKYRFFWNADQAPDVVQGTVANNYSYFDFTSNIDNDNYKTQGITCIYLYKRAVGNDEVTYAYNNLSGSDPQNVTGLMCKCNCQLAEYLDFSAAGDGSDMRIGCADLSGNRNHLQIINLPSGTVDDQLAYANSTLIVPFTS